MKYLIIPLIIILSGCRLNSKDSLIKDDCITESHITYCKSTVGSASTCYTSQSTTSISITCNFFDELKKAIESREAKTQFQEIEKKRR